MGLEMVKTFVPDKCLSDSEVYQNGTGNVLLQAGHKPTLVLCQEGEARKAMKG